jgi:hypothetical protein
MPGEDSCKVIADVPQVLLSVDISYPDGAVIIMSSVKSSPSTSKDCD